MIDRSTMFSSDSRVRSSSIDAIFTDLPSTVESNWKYRAHNTFGASASIVGTTTGRHVCGRRGPTSAGLPPYTSDGPSSCSPRGARRTATPPRHAGTRGTDCSSSTCSAIPAVQHWDRRGVRERHARVGGSGKPDRSACEPPRQAQHVLEHVDGTALGARAQNLPLATSRRASFASSTTASSHLSQPFCSRAHAVPSQRRRPRHRRSGASCTTSQSTLRGRQLSHRWSYLRQRARLRGAACARRLQRATSSGQPCVS